MTISIKPTASGSTIEQDGSTILTVDGSGNITPSNDLYPKVPAFSAYANADLTISDATFTKVPINTVRYDTTSDFDTTNYRFNPSVAGYYQINGDIRFSGGTNITAAIFVFYKNGSQFEGPNLVSGISTSSNLTLNGSTMVYLNGTTDYIEMYGWTDVSGGTPRFDYANDIFTSHFSGHLVSV